MMHKHTARRSTMGPADHVKGRARRGYLVRKVRTLIAGRGSAWGLQHARRRLAGSCLRHGCLQPLILFSMRPPPAPVAIVCCQPHNTKCDTCRQSSKYTLA